MTCQGSSLGRSTTVKAGEALQQYPAAVEGSEGLQQRPATGPRQRPSMPARAGSSLLASCPVHDSQGQ